MAWTEQTPPISPKYAAKRRIMVVADPTRESAGALQYTLSHAMQDKDELVLVHVMNPNAKKPMTFRSLFRKNSDPNVDSATTLAAMVEGNVGGGDGRDPDFLEIMKRACEAAHSNSKVWIEKVEQGSMDKGVAIMYKCKLLCIDLLVVGQRRHLSAVLLGPRRSTSTSGLRGVTRTTDTAEFLIENSPCTCVAVQKKGQNAGYLLNSKTHRNFWLLA
ncbi:hypothetical protein RND81_13G034700 [Saponaria officinalis]|uniref:UspA domain-containing protein n=1 Tax=Saponaria officinalis TaxID=3572 RepID=A0AAW1GWD9_SAPOF